MPMLITSQKPERVSNILRSSTASTRVAGIGAWAWRSRRTTEAGVVAVRVLMLLLLRGRGRAGTPR